MAKTKIEWSDVVWNPTTGCDQVSPGCDNCYALTMAKRLKAMGNPRYQHDGREETSGPGFGMTLHHDKLEEPLRWRKPRRVFVNSMSDLFHPDVPDEFVARVFGVMAATGRHTYQVLTKRHARMRALVNDDGFREHVGRVTPWFVGRGVDLPADPAEPGWPLPNVWLGVSVEDQERADARVPALLDTPAAVRFLSCEPLLGPVDLRLEDCWLAEDHYVAAERIGWVIVGGESGHHARPMHPDWARSLRDQCRTAGVPFFLKQWGAWRPAPHVRDVRDRDVAMYRDGTTVPIGSRPDGWWYDEPVAVMQRVGKKAAGRTLDGQTWDEFPDVGVPA